jgi:hypothetical protein
MQWQNEKGKMLEDTKGAIRSYKSKDREYNGQMKKDKWTNNDLQNTTQKTKYRGTRTPLTQGVNSKLNIEERELH